MLSKEEFIDFILRGPQTLTATVVAAPEHSALPEGFEGFAATDVHSTDPGDTSTFARRLLEASGFGYPELVGRNVVIRSSDPVAEHLPNRVSFWPKTPSRPYQTLLFETPLTHKELLDIPAFRVRKKISHLDMVEDALARLVSEALDGFQRGGESVTADVRKGRKQETLCIISVLDSREGDPVRLVCFGTQNRTTEGLETFQITERTRFWDGALAREHLGLVYERQFKKLSTENWQEAFTTTEERKQAEKLVEICTRKTPREVDIQEGVLDLLDTIAKGFGLRRKPNTERRLQAFALPPDHDIGIDPEERASTFGGRNPFGGVTLCDEQSRLLGYIVYPLSTREDATRLRKHLETNNCFHNVLVVYPDQDEANFELWQGREQLTGKLRKGQGFRDAAEIVNLLSRFFIVSKAKARNPAELAQELAYRARYLRRLAVRQLEEEQEKGPIRNLYNAFKASLVQEQTEEEFADAFAQTVTYGLLTARWIGNDQLVAAGERFTRLTALKHLPATSPFLNDLFKSALAVKLDVQRGRLLWLVDDISALLDRIDVSYVFGAGDVGSDNATDPVIHFYEPFLAAYDKELKNKRGVFFTPKPVVSYIVRSVHELLQQEFGLDDGLASTDTWGDVVKRQPSLTIPYGMKATDPFVCILDPATGTGTFLFECIDIIEHTVKTKCCRELKTDSWDDPGVMGRWTAYVSAHLLPRIHGYELMMASYAVAHLKLSFKLAESGYHLRPDDRLRVFLTNSLAPPSDTTQKTIAGTFPALAHEAQAVDRIKRNQRFTVVIGNPPYSKISSNLTPEMRAIVERYRYLNGERIKERGALQFEINLQDDYVKFCRTCEEQFNSSTVGVLGLITNNGYLSTPTLRGMRDSLLETFSSIWVVDLHGHLAKGELGPSGSPEENIFDILQGVALLLASRVMPKAGDAAVFHTDHYGTRASKYDFLRSNSLATTHFAHIQPSPPFYLFVPHDAALAQEWNGYVGIDDLFPRNSAGIITARDRLVIACNKRELAERIELFSKTKKADDAIYEEFGFSESKRFDLREAQGELRKLKSFSEPIRRLLHRPFDRRYIFFHPSVVWSLSRPMADQMLDGHNLALVATRQVTRPQFEHAFVSRDVIEIKACSHDRNTQMFPLFVGESDGQLTFGAASPNLDPGLMTKFAKELGLTFNGKTRTSGGEGELAARCVFDYVYAILYSPSYRVRYFEFLRSEFPRLPLTKDLKLFRSLERLGGELVALHLLESRKLDNVPATYTGSAKPEVEKISHNRQTVWLDRAQTCGFGGVPDDVWRFNIGGYPVCEKWLKDRRGCSLSKSDIEHYEKIVFALKETIGLMKKIDGVIDQHGGWPEAFETRLARRNR